MNGPLVELSKVSKSYREGQRLRPVLDGADLQIAAGELVAVVGRSGSGKSTLLNLLSGIDRADSGEVKIGKSELGALDEHHLTLLRRHRIGFVFQFFNLIPTLTVEENLLLPLDLCGNLDSESKAAALERLAAMGLADRRSSFPDVLSGGEQQRLAIARALAHDPPLILADEPTGNLDAETADAVLELLNQSLRQAGKTLVMATHSRTAAAIADRVLTLREGRLVELEAA